VTIAAIRRAGLGPSSITIHQLTTAIRAKSIVEIQSSLDLARCDFTSLDSGPLPSLAGPAEAVNLLPSHPAR